MFIPQLLSGQLSIIADHMVVFLQFLYMIYFLFVNFVDLYPFNNLRDKSIGRRIHKTLIKGLLLFVPPVGFYFEISGLMILGLLIYLALLTGYYASWWHPYFFGSGRKQDEMLQKAYNKTIQILPPIKSHPRPNAELTVQHILALIAATASIVAFFFH